MRQDRRAETGTSLIVPSCLTREAPRPVATQRVLRLLQRARAEAALSERGRLHVGVSAEDLLAAAAQRERGPVAEREVGVELPFTCPKALSTSQAFAK
jgi:hypothetical protein